MSVLIRDVRPDELGAILTMNNSAGTSILPMDEARLQHLFDTAEYFRVAVVDEQLHGFIIGYGSGAHHDSSNFDWFRRNHPAFFYIDRIVVDNETRGGGVGRILYADAESYAELRYPQLATEVLMDEMADKVLLFHGTIGFREVGQRKMESAGIRASMLMKPLYSYEWIHATYGDKLPDAAWIIQPRVGTSVEPRTTL